jgi:cytochrome P450
VIETADFPSEATLRCPHAIYGVLRDEAPVYKLPHRDEWVVSRHADVRHIAMHPEVFSSQSAVFDDGWMRAATLADVTADRPRSIVMSDAPEHTFKRRMAFELFKPGRLRQHETMIRGHVDDLLDDFAGHDVIEFRSAFAAHLPVRVILTIFGVSFDYVDEAITWSRYEGFGTRFLPPDKEQAARDTIMEQAAFIHRLILERLEHPGEDDFSRFVQSHLEAEGELDMASLISDASNLFTGGTGTTMHLLSTLLMLLLKNPEQMEKLRADASLIPAAVEEALRYESPVNLAPRIVLEDTEVSGVAIPKGAIVIGLWGAANRDGRVFSNPTAFDVSRSDVRKHMAFGSGPHTCPGGPLARLEARIVFEQLLERFEKIELVPDRDDFEHMGGVQFNGPDTLHITVTPR